MICPIANKWYRWNPILGLGILVTFTCFLALGAGSQEGIRIEIGTLPGLRYDIRRFDVEPGAEVTLEFRNQDTMLHNLVIVNPGKRLEIVQLAAMLGAKADERQFVPESPNVLWATEVIASGESSTLRFTAPQQVGDYPYVCTYPGHGLLMYGAMRVTATPGALERNRAVAVVGIDHVGHESGAFVKRSFMPESGPASIAVRLPGGHAYCWDAGACCFRYAWKGGFVEPVYRKPERILGEVYYRESHDFPFLLGKDHPKRPQKTQFLGYSLDPMGIPEFEYTADGVRFFERLEVREDRLVRRIRTLGEVAADCWFKFDPKYGQQLESTGTREGGVIRFPISQGNEFYLTISPQP